MQRTALIMPVRSFHIQDLLGDDSNRHRHQGIESCVQPKGDFETRVIDHPVGNTYLDDDDSIHDTSSDIQIHQKLNERHVQHPSHQQHLEGTLDLYKNRQ